MRILASPSRVFYAVSQNVHKNKWNLVQSLHRDSKRVQTLLSTIRNQNTRGRHVAIFHHISTTVRETEPQCILSASYIKIPQTGESKKEIQTFLL